MYQVEDEPMETIHLYVVREQRKPSALLPLLAAMLCLLAIAGVTAYSAQYPAYEQETLALPAKFLPLQTFSAAEPVIPTGIKTWPATTAQGMLTITNGSVIAQALPQGLIFTGNDGIEVVTDEAVFVPAGSAAGYGITYVAARAMAKGRNGNIPALDIDSVEGSSVYIRNIRPFTGGHDAYSVTLVTQQDRQNALDAARAYLAAQESRIKAILESQCSEVIAYGKTLLVTWNCLFAAYPDLPGYRILGVKVAGKNLLVHVAFLPRPRPFTGR